MQTLSERQRQVLVLLGQGDMWQSDVAARLGISRPRVNQITKKLESLGLLKRKVETEIRGPTEQRHYYQAAPEAKVPQRGFNICHVHRVRMKFRILKQNASISADPRTGWNKSAKLRGWTKHFFWFDGKTPLPNISIEVTPKHIIAYMDKGQMITAKDIEQAEEIAWYAIYRARDRFVEAQQKFGVNIELETTGTRKENEVEYGFLYHKDSGVGEAVKPLPPNWWDDASVEPEFPGHREFETNVRSEAVQVHGAIHQLQAMPEMMQKFESMFGEVNGNVKSVLAQVQGNQPVEDMFLRTVDLLSRMTDRMNRLEDRQEYNRSFTISQSGITAQSFGKLGKPFKNINCVKLGQAFRN